MRSQQPRQDGFGFGVALRSPDIQEWRIEGNARRAQQPSLSLNSEADLPSVLRVHIQQEDGSIPLGQICPTWSCHLARW
jgi:hypothetical protein